MSVIFYPWFFIGKQNMKRSVYFDYAASAIPDREVLELFMRESMAHYANAEAVHALSYRARRALKSAGERVSAALFNKNDFPVIWGNSATELFRVLASCPDFRTSCASNLEHPALSANLKNFSSLQTFPVDRAGKPAVTAPENPADLGCCFQVQSELGVIGDCAGFFSASNCRCRMIDAVQAAGKMPLDKSGEVWVISGVKFGSPGGAAMLLAPDGRFTEKILKHAEVCRKSDYAVCRVSIPMMLSLSAALEKAVAGMKENFQKISAINRFLRHGCLELGMEATLPDGVQTSPYILNMLFPAQESAVVIRALSERGVYAASGSACSAESDRPSAALTALGFPAKKAYRALRLSFGAGNCMEDAEIFLSELKTVLKNY